MLTGLGGSLLSQHFAEHVLPVEFAGQLGEHSAAVAYKGFARWWSTQAVHLGPASSLRTIWETGAAPLAEQLGYSVGSALDGPLTRHATLESENVRLALLVTAWDVSLDTLWREAVRRGLRLGASWVLCTNGHQLRVIDARRTYSRGFIGFDLQKASVSFPTFALLWAVLRGAAFREELGRASLVSRLIQASARHGQTVSRSLRGGVIAAVQHMIGGLSRCERKRSADLFDESLTVVYRILFLMFAEARGLVPNWHPLYKNSYTIESLRDRAERPGRAPGLWEALQAIARLAHRGCSAGTLVVPAFNGRLFSPVRSPVAESCAVSDETARQALLALSTATQHPRPVRIDYRDLGVEQLGAVYESVLDYEPVEVAHPRRIELRRGGGRRKSTGSFYTPQSITEFLVRRTLHPLAADASAKAILKLRIVDPAMGSAAFLVAACRYLSNMYERALVREGAARESDIDDGDRAMFRRQVAQRCLFGVDLNPTAVQLARLSLWLATLASGKPLTFLDHRLVCGNSLLGASPVDLARQPPTVKSGRRQRTETSLFSDADFELSVSRAVSERQWLAETGDDTAEVVREKERRLEAVRASAKWKPLCDLWCACWMWPDRAATPDAAVFAALSDRLESRDSGLPENLAVSLLRKSDEIARQHRFFHWHVEFPEVFFDETGRTQVRGGFDAILGNPPWDMLGSSDREKVFYRSSGVYRHQGSGRINRYQVFVERALNLVRPEGRIGLVLPSGFATDHTAAPLRRHLLSAIDVDTITGFDNRRAIFPIHRSVRFLLCTATAGRSTSRIACRFGIDDTGELERFPDSGEDTTRGPDSIALTRAFITALGGPSSTIPEVRAHLDLQILERLVAHIPRLGDINGWNARFGRELNATDDRNHFHRGGQGLPVLEGKHIEPFQAHVDRADMRMSERAAARRLDAAATYRRIRLAYRDVASSSNRLSLIAAILPRGVITTHSLFCLKNELSSDNQAFLCAILNSYVANYLVRQVMTTHLGSTTVEALRVPKPPRDSSDFQEIVELSRCLARSWTGQEHARVQALAARCYGLTTRELAHVLDTFPLVDQLEKADALEAFRR